MDLFAQDVKPSFVLANGTGKVITDVQVKPSKKKYPHDKNVCYFQGIAFNDQQSFPVLLPEQMKNLDSFDIIIKYGGKTAKTKRSMAYEITDQVPLFVASIKGKDSTIPLVSGAAGGGATVAALGTGLGISVATYGAGGFTYYMALIGSVVGGGMVAGAAVVAAVPLVVAAGIFGAVTLFSAETMILTKVDYAPQ
jgi:hypothetical protein